MSFLIPNKQVILVTFLSKATFDLTNGDGFINEKRQVFFEKREVHCRYIASLNVMAPVRDLDPEPYSTVRPTWEDYRELTGTSSIDSCIDCMNKTFLESGVSPIQDLNRRAGSLALVTFENIIGV